MTTFVIISLLLFPITLFFILGGDEPAAFVIGAILSLFAFVIIAISTDKVIGTEIVKSKDYTIETTQTRQFVYIKNRERVVIRTLVFDKVEDYNLINSNNYDVALEKRKNLFWEHDGQYNVRAKVVETPEKE